MVYQLDPSEWTVEEVKDWMTDIFNNSEIGEKFKQQEIDGQMLLQSERILQDNSMEVLGLDTIGKKDKFTTSVAKLRGKLVSIVTKKPKLEEYTNDFEEIDKKEDLCFC